MEQITTPTPTPSIRKSLGKGINRVASCDECGKTYKQRIISPETSGHLLRHLQEKGTSPTPTPTPTPETGKKGKGKGKGN